MGTQPTGTGLDRLVDIIETDAGVARNVSDSNIEKGADAAAGLNAMIVQGIRALGAANDGTIDAADLRGLGDWVQSNKGRYDTYLQLYGPNNSKGFQLVQGEDSSKFLFGEDAIDEIADAIYSFGFGSTSGNKILDVDGNPYRSVNLTANWLDKLLTDQDMKELSNPNGSTVVEGTTGTGLDRIVEIINDDPGLVRNVSSVDIAKASRAVDAMNHMYLDGMKTLGLVNDGKIDKSDVIALDNWVRSDAGRLVTYKDLSADWRLVYNKGADIDYVGINDSIHPHVGHVVNHAFRAIYEIGYGVKDGFLIGPSGKAEVSARLPAPWFDQLLDGKVQGTGGHSGGSHGGDHGGGSSTQNPDTSGDNTAKDDLVNPEGSTVVKGTTGTGLDEVIDIIVNDPGLARNVSRNDIAEGAEAADAMNSIIVDVIDTLGLAKDGSIDRADVKKMSDYIRSDDALHDEFLALHGSEYSGRSGFHLVQGQGGTEKLFGKWAVNNVFDAMYSLGREIESHRFVEDDGDLSYGANLAARGIDEFFFG